MSQRRDGGGHGCSSRDERLSRATRAHRLLLKASTSSTAVLLAAGWRLYKKTTEDSQTIHGLVTIEARVLLTR